jgi:hypothetical protein
VIAHAQRPRAEDAIAHAKCISDNGMPASGSPAMGPVLSRGKMLRRGAPVGRALVPREGAANYFQFLAEGFPAPWGAGEGA